MRGLRIERTARPEQQLLPPPRLVTARVRVRVRGRVRVRARVRVRVRDRIRVRVSVQVRDRVSVQVRDRVRVRVRGCESAPSSPDSLDSTSTSALT